MLMIRTDYLLYASFHIVCCELISNDNKSVKSVNKKHQKRNLRTISRVLQN